MSAKDPIVTLTVDTDNISELNKNNAVEFTDNVGDPKETPGDPDSYVTSISPNQTISWLVKAQNASTPIVIQNIQKEFGFDLIEHPKRGMISNTYSAHVKDDNSIKVGDSESYSITISLSGYQGIAGNNQWGPVVFLGRKLAYMNNYVENNWHEIGPAGFDIKGMCGENTHGIIIFNGRKVSYMNNYLENKWLQMPDAPFDIEGITGDNLNGPIIYNGKKVAYFDVNLFKWLDIGDAPFELDGITGDNRNGIIGYSGNRVVVISNFAENNWTEVEKAPFVIEGITGQNPTGPIIYAGRQISYMNDYSKNQWHAAGPSPFIIEGISGNNALGFVVYNKQKIKYLNNYTENKWTDVKDIPFDPKTYTIDPRMKVKEIGTIKN